MIDLSFNNKRKPEKGSLLLSDPFLSDNYFTRSLVLLCDHNDEGSFGFVLNNYIDIDLHKLHPQFPKIESKIALGGPVDKQSIFYIHDFGSDIDASIPIADGLYFGGDFDQIVQKINDNIDNNKRVRFFLGYAGWSPNQLIEEFDANSWIVVEDFSKKEILDTDLENSWKMYMNRQGGKFKIMSTFPLNPNNN